MHLMAASLGKWMRLGVCCSLLGAGQAVMADNEPRNMTAGEIALLPVWCKDAQSFGYGDASFNTSPRAPYWISVMGKTFWAAHHHCWALVRMHRSRAAGIDANTKRFLIEGAIGDYQYVIANATPDFPLTPEVFTRMGEAYVELGAMSQALEAFEAARKSKPDYWPPYVRWAAVLISMGKAKEGLEYVEPIVKARPDDAELQRQHKALQAAARKAPVRASHAAAAPPKPGKGGSTAASAAVAAPGPAAAASAVAR